MSEQNYWQKLSQARLGRRRLLAGAVGAAGVGVAVAACKGAGSGSSDQAQATPQLTPQPGGRLQLAAESNFISIDPQLTVGSGIAIVAWLYTYLFHFSGAVPDVTLLDQAETLEQPDDVTYLFRLRQGVRTPPDRAPIPDRALDAEDVVKTLERVRDLPGSTGGTFIKEWVASFESPDAGTIVVKTKEPYAWTMDTLGSPAGMAIVPRELIASGVDLRTSGGGAGPFFLARYRDGEIASVDRNVNYWAAPLPFIDGIDFKIITDRASRRTAFLSRQVDMYSPQNVREKDQLAGQDKRIVIEREPSLSYVSLGMRADQDPFKDGRVRRAIAEAVDRQEYIDKLSFSDGQPDGPVGWGLDFWALDQDELSRLQPYDLDDARAQLSAAGYGDGLTVECVYPQGEAVEDHVTILIEQLKKVGVTLDLQPLPLTAWYFDRYQKGKFTFTVAANLPYESPQVPLTFFHSKGVQGDGNWHGFADPEIDALIDRAAHTLDLNQRESLVKDAQRLILQRDPVMLNIYSSYDYGARWDYIHGTKPMQRSLALFNRDFWLSRNA